VRLRAIRWNISYSRRVKVQSLTKCSFKNCHKKQFSPDQMNGEAAYNVEWYSFNLPEEKGNLTYS